MATDPETSTEDATQSADESCRGRCGGQDLGPRAAARRDARRRRLRLIVVGVLALGAVAVLGLVLGPLLLDGSEVADQQQDDDTTIGAGSGQRRNSTAAQPGTSGQQSGQTASADSAPAGDADPTVLLTTVDPTGPRPGRARNVIVLGYDDSTDRGTILLVPSTLAVDVPGFGLQQLAAAQEVGGARLVGLSLTNLLDLDIDANVTLSQQDWAALFARVGGFEVALDDRLVGPGQGDQQVVLEAGTRSLDGERLARLLTLVQQGETELDALPRTQLVLEGLLATLGDGGIEAIFGDGAPMLDTPDTGTVEQVLRGLTSAARTGRLDVRTVPVAPIGAGRDASYRLDQPAAEELVGERFAARRDDRPDAGVRLEIRNGNGAPGIGAEVAERLVPLGHTVVLTGNAERFDVEQTRVVVYEDRPAVVRAAQGIVDALGTGRVEISGVPQGIADVTVLVGEDFAP